MLRPLTLPLDFLDTSRVSPNEWRSIRIRTFEELLSGRFFLLQQRQRDGQQDQIGGPSGESLGGHADHAIGVHPDHGQDETNDRHGDQ